MLCSACKTDFPADLIQTLNVNGKRSSVCGVCALAAIRDAHGDQKYQFRPDSMAADVYRRSLAHKANAQERNAQP